MREDHLLFERILQSYHPLCAEIVRGVVLPFPGIYFIRNGTDLEVKYVGRSSTNLQRRLICHSSKKLNHFCYFSFLNVKKAVEAYRLETSAIFYFSQFVKLENRINAALPHDLKR